MKPPIRPEALERRSGWLWLGAGAGLLILALVLGYGRDRTDLRGSVTNFATTVGAAGTFAASARPAARPLNEERRPPGFSRPEEASGRAEAASPGQVELALVQPELQWLVNQGEMLGDPGRDAARLAGLLLSSRFQERRRLVGDRTGAPLPLPEPDAASSENAPAVDPAPTAARREWAATLEQDGLVQGDYLRAAGAEWQRLGVPMDQQPMLNRFLLESVRDIEVLCEIGQQLEGGEIRAFPEAVTGGTGPIIGQESLLAAYYYREVTRRMLQRMGVALDEQFLGVLLSHGLGRPITPLSSFNP